MIFDIVTEMVREICREVFSLNQVAVTRARAILVDPIHDYYRPKDEHTYLGRVLDKLEDLQLRHRHNNFFDKIHHQLVPRGEAHKYQGVLDKRDKKKGVVDDLDN